MAPARLAALVASVLLAAACGSDDDAATTTTEGPTTVAATAPGTAVDETAESTTPDTAVDETVGATTPDTEGVDTTAPTTGAPTTDVGPALDRDATLRVGWASPPRQWDPHRSANQLADLPYLTQVYDGLVALTIDNEVVARVATTWTVSDDGLEYEFKIRDGLTFHDGTPLDAAAVVASLDRARAEESTVKGQLAAVAEVTAPSAGVVTIRLTEPEPTLLYVLAAPTGAIISPAALASGVDLQTQPAGSGPYRFVSQDATTAYLERFEDYWDPAQNPVAAKEISGYPDLAARVNAIRTGEEDLIELPVAGIADAQGMLDSGDFQSYIQASKRDTLLFMNVGMAPLDNPEVRQAINMAINRAGINEAVLEGRCEPLDGPFTPGFPGHNPDLDSPYDPDAAAEIIERTGAGDIPLQILQLTSAPNGTIAEIIQQQLAEIGMDVSLVAVDPTQARPTWREGNHAMWVLSSSVLSPDPASLFATTYGPDLPGGLPADIAAAAAAADLLPLGSEERDEAWQGVATMLNEAAIHAPICTLATEWLFTDAVVNVDNMPYAQFNATPDTRYVGFSGSSGNGG